MPNNKKGKGKSRKKADSAAARDDEASLLQRIQSTLPTFQDTQPRSNHDSTTKSGGYYNQYKEATLQFHNWMAKWACLSGKMSAVNDYRTGVEQILKNNWSVFLSKQAESFILAPPEIMASLTSSIRLREKVTINIFGSKAGGDLGHQYIIDVLKHCQKTLRFANRMAAAVYNTRDGNEKIHAIGGRFSALKLDDEEEESEEDWKDIDRDIKEGNLPTYTGVEVEEEIDIREMLLKGDDRFQAIALLYTMDDLMGNIRVHYKLLKDYMRGDRNVYPSSSCVPLLMKCAVVANVAIDTVHRAENELAVEHPHLSSFYHILALVVWADVIAQINKRIGKTTLMRDPHMTLQFVAEVIKCSFRERDGSDEISPIAKRFSKKSSLDMSIAYDYATLIDRDTDFETRVQSEIGRERDTSGDTDRPHMWLSPLNYIGGDCCIINTLHSLQAVTRILGNNPTARINTGGPSFDENTRPARRIWGDLDRPFISCILVELHRTCKNVPFEKFEGWPYLVNILGLFWLYLKSDPTKPVPIALCFGMHAILMSIFVLQGDGDLARVAASAKRSYNLVFEQWQNGDSSDYDIMVYQEFHRYSCFAGIAKPFYPISQDRSGCHRDASFLEPAHWRGIYAFCDVYRFHLPGVFGR
jgi:hypothetical protein